MPFLKFVSLLIVHWKKIKLGCLPAYDYRLVSSLWIVVSVIYTIPIKYDIALLCKLGNLIALYKIITLQLWNNISYHLVRFSQWSRYWMVQYHSQFSQPQPSYMWCRELLKNWSSDIVVDSFNSMLKLSPTFCHNNTDLVAGDIAISLQYAWWIPAQENRVRATGYSNNTQRWTTGHWKIKRKSSMQQP